MNERNLSASIYLFTGHLRSHFRRKVGFVVWNAFFYRRSKSGSFLPVPFLKMRVYGVLFPLRYNLSNQTLGHSLIGTMTDLNIAVSLITLYSM